MRAPPPAIQHYSTKKTRLSGETTGLAVALYLDRRHSQRCLRTNDTQQHNVVYLIFDDDKRQSLGFWRTRNCSEYFVRQRWVVRLDVFGSI